MLLSTPLLTCGRVTITGEELVRLVLNQGERLIKQAGGAEALAAKWKWNQ